MMDEVLSIKEYALNDIKGLRLIIHKLNNDDKDHVEKLCDASENMVNLLVSILANNTKCNDEYLDTSESYRKAVDILLELSRKSLKRGYNAKVYKYTFSIDTNILNLSKILSVRCKNF